MRPLTFYIRLMAVLCSCLCRQHAAAQVTYKDTLFLKGDNDEELSEYLYSYEDKARNTGLLSAVSLQKSGKFHRTSWHKPFSTGVSTANYWLYIRIHNSADRPLQYLYSLYASIDTAVFYLCANNEHFAAPVTISNITPLTERPYPVRSLSFPFLLPSNTTGEIYVYLINRHSGIFMPMDITTTDGYLLWENRFYWTWGWYMGFFLFAAVLGLLVYLALRDQIYLWYGLYVLGNMVFLCREDLLDIAVFPYPVYRALQATDLYTFALFSMLSGLRIMQLFTRQKRENTFFYTPATRLFKTGLIYFALLLFTDLLPSAYHTVTIQLWTDYITKALVTLCCFLILASLIEMMLKKNKLATYYFFSILSLYLGYINIFLNGLHITSFNPVRPNLVTVGLAIELIVLSLLLVYRYKAMARKNVLLLQKQAEMEQTNLKNIIETQEEERSRIASDLHDGLGATLGALKLLISNSDATNKEQLLTVVNNAGTETRNIAHNLLPDSFLETGLYESLLKLKVLLGQQSDTEFDFILLGQDQILPPAVSIQVFRMIHEAINNILKHAIASRAGVQVITESNNIQIIVEDNGVGIPEKAKETGMGLKNIRTRVSYLQGQLHIDSTAKGTTLIIELPLAQTQHI